MKIDEIPEWQKEFDKRLKENKKSYELLNKVQQSAIKSAEQTMKNVVQMLEECNLSLIHISEPTRPY